MHNGLLRYLYKKKRLTVEMIRNLNKVLNIPTNVLEQEY